MLRPHCLVASSRVSRDVAGSRSCAEGSARKIDGLHSVNACFIVAFHSVNECLIVAFHSVNGCLIVAFHSVKVCSCHAFESGVRVSSSNLNTTPRVRRSGPAKRGPPNDLPPALAAPSASRMLLRQQTRPVGGNNRTHLVGSIGRGDPRDHG